MVLVSHDLPGNQEAKEAGLECRDGGPRPYLLKVLNTLNLRAMKQAENSGSSEDSLKRVIIINQTNTL